MNGKIENIDIVVQNWLDSADQNFATMKNLLRSGDYSWALFIGHLVIEKTLKALYVKKKNEHALFTHDLLRLSSKIGLDISEEQQDWLDEITTFNLNARYDNYKQLFAKLCTKEFTEVRISRIEIIRQWLINQF
ncbi:MAG: DNA-binding protein [Bacteroidetes bacterium]|nr:MAG: DNA-binding protein [Bacteroidota bacterium]